MDGKQFDSLTRRMAGGMTRRAAIRGAAAGVLGALGLRRAIDAQVSQAQCGNVACKNNPGKCAPGCVCCVHANGNSRCQPPGKCSGGSEICPADRPYVDLARGCVQCLNAGQCPAPAGACQVATCTAGVCGVGPAPAGTACNDGNACTRTDACDGAGACIGGNPVVCAASDGCHVAGTCDPATGACSNPNAPEGTACDDGNPCTVGDTCRSGACTAGPGPDCSGQTDACNDGVCRASDGVCVKQPKVNGTGCNADNDSCTAGDSCQNGVCTAGTGTSCASVADQCNDGVCRSSDGVCVKQPKTDGTECNADSDACTVGDTCQAGVCVAGLPRECRACQTCSGGDCVAVATDDRCPAGCCGGICCRDDETCVSGTCQAAVCITIGNICNTTDNRCCAADPTCAQSCSGFPTCCRQPGGVCATTCDCCGTSAQCAAGRCCQGTGGACAGDGDCCLGLGCSGGTCQVACRDVGEACADNDDCCGTGICDNGRCLPCRALGEVCPGDGVCCDDGVTLCEGGQCCHPFSESCAFNAECCSFRCQDGSCCQPPGSECSDDGDCCFGQLGACRQGVCTCQLTGDACEQNDDCCDGDSCRNGVCRPEVCQDLQGECVFDTDCCADTAFCRAGGTPNGCCSVTNGPCTERADCCGAPDMTCIQSRCQTCLGEEQICNPVAQAGCCEDFECRFDDRGYLPGGKSYRCLPQFCLVTQEECGPGSLECCDGAICAGPSPFPPLLSCCQPEGGACRDGLGTPPGLGDCCPSLTCNGARQCAPCRQRGESCDGNEFGSNCCFVFGGGDICVNGVCVARNG